jgi:hypothetical protein
MMNEPMHDGVDGMLARLAESSMPADLRLEQVIAARVAIRRVDLTTYRAGALAVVGALLMGIGVGFAPAAATARSHPLGTLNAMAMAPSTLLGGSY